MKIIAVGWNYKNHNEEMGQGMPSEPVIFLKPETALLKDGKPFFLPDFSQRIEYESELVVKVCRLGKNIAARFAYRYYNEITVGIDFTARDIQQRQREQGSPWEIAKGFDGSAVIGNFIPVSSLVPHTPFSLRVNDVIVQQGSPENMIFSIDEIIAYVSRFFTLKIGDLIYTGTPSGVGPVKINDHLTGYIGDEKLLDFRVK
ncbi:MAG: fumarylacetoacetate hydrolase family protein [Barnesiella sp.]